MLKKHADSLPIKPWGAALEQMRELRGLDKGEVVYGAKMDRPQYRSTCFKLSEGPSWNTVWRLTKGLNCTFEELGRLFDALVREGHLEPEYRERKSKRKPVVSIHRKKKATAR